ncbi:MAG: hypothetical protein ACHQIO_16430 [Nevskiales bacterium]
MAVQPPPHGHVVSSVPSAMSAGRSAEDPAIAALPHSIAAAVGRLDPACVIAFCLTFVLLLFLPQLLNDGDTLWQIRTGEWILNHHAIPAIDPFSYTAGDRKWFAHEWLAETMLALAWRAGGMSGVVALVATAAGLTAAILLRYLRRFLPGIYAVAALVVAFANTAPSMLARPHLLAWPCLVLWCCGLLDARANRVAPSFWLMPVMLLWVNLHGSFMAGLLLPAVFMVEALFEPGIDRRRTFAIWARFILAAWATGLLNPDFLAGELFPIHLLGMRSLAWIGEWQPADFSHSQLLELMILGGLALGFSGAVRLPPVRLLILLGLVHSALSHVRNEQLLGLVGALILAEPIGASLGRGGAATLGTTAWRRLAAATALVTAVALTGRLAFPLSPERTGAAFAAALEQVPPALRAKPVLNDYSLGGQLIFQGVRPFIDGRADLYGDVFLARYWRIISPDRDALDHALAEYGIAWTIFPAGAPIVRLLDQEPGWRRLIEANGMVIQARE